MPVPSYRVPVKLARGTYDNLAAALASLEEGEICYANDQNSLYVVEGGVLTLAGGGSGIDNRGDGGDFETMTVDALFTTNVLGGGDFETGTIDPPVENLGLRDGGLFT